MNSKIKEYNHERLLLLKKAKLRMLESQLEYQNKQKDIKGVHQTMKDISKVQSEIQGLI